MARGENRVFPREARIGTQLIITTLAGTASKNSLTSETIGNFEGVSSTTYSKLLATSAHHAQLRRYPHPPGDTKYLGSMTALVIVRT